MLPPVPVVSVAPDALGSLVPDVLVPGVPLVPGTLGPGALVPLVFGSLSGEKPVGVISMAVEPFASGVTCWSST
jgi:hypothetical protein